MKREHTCYVMYMYIFFLMGSAFKVFSRLAVLSQIVDNFSPF